MSLDTGVKYPGMARREIKLPYTEKRMVCPHCRADLIFGTVMGTIVQSNRTCPKCGKDFLIENDLPKKPTRSVKNREQARPERPAL